MRKINRTNKPLAIPLNWLCDGVEDCQNGSCNLKSFFYRGDFFYYAGMQDPCE